MVRIFLSRTRTYVYEQKRRLCVTYFFLRRVEISIGLIKGKFLEIVLKKDMLEEVVDLHALMITGIPPLSVNLCGYTKFLIGDVASCPYLAYRQFEIRRRICMRNLMDRQVGCGYDL